MSMPEQMVSVRYMVDDVHEAVDFYTGHLGFTLLSSAAPAFADVARGSLRLLLGGPASSAGRPMPDGRKPGPGGWNRIHLIVEDIAAEVARLRAEGVRFRNEIVAGPGGKQILIEDPAGNVVELFQPAASSPDPAAACRPTGRRRTGPGRCGRGRPVGGARHGAARVGPDRLHRVRRAADPHQAAARACASSGRTGWTRGEFEDAIAACNLLPGPASTQLAIFCAWRVRGRRGALAGGAAFIVPGLIVILALAALFLAQSPPLWVLGAGAGAGAAVPAVAVRAGTRLLGASWRRRKQPCAGWSYLIAGAAAAATIGPWLVWSCWAAAWSSWPPQRAVPADRPSGIAAIPALLAAAQLSPAGCWCRWPGSRSRSARCLSAAGS